MLLSLNSAITIWLLKQSHDLEPSPKFITWMECKFEKFVIT